MQYIIDIGAHVGWYLDQWVKGTNNTIFAFEPNPVNLHTLRHKYANNANVIIIPYAVGATKGTVKLYRAPDDDFNEPKHTGRSSVRRDNSNVGDEFFEVQMIRLSDFIDDMCIEQFRVLKIDTEGNEHVILDDLLDNGLINKFDEIIFENHDFLFEHDNSHAMREKVIFHRLAQEFKGKVNSPTEKRWT